MKATELVCDNCASPAYRCQLCHRHWLEQISKFQPEAFGLEGVLLQDGSLRPDYGEGWADCRCAGCGATVSALVGSACPWCRAKREQLADHQAEILLTPPEIDVDDRHYDKVMVAWSERVARGCEADIITIHEARRVLTRAVNASGTAA